MGAVCQRRQRLTSSFIAIFALAASSALAIGEAAAQAVQCDRNVVPRGASYSEITPTIRLAQDGILNAASEQTLRDWEASCTRELRDRRNRHNIDAYVCVAEARAKQASLNRSEQVYREAYCANTAVAGLAGRQHADVAARANQNRGDILMALREINNPNSTLGASLLSQAIVDYRAAVSRPTAGRHFALGRAYAAQGATAEATRQMELGASVTPANADEAAEAVRALVTIAGVENDAPANAVSLLETARNLDNRYRGARAPSMAVNAALGVRYAQANRPTDAAASFRAAIGGYDDTAPYSGRNYLAEANYYLASQAIAGGDWAGAFTQGQAALRAGGSGNPKFGRLVCLAYIARGWSTQTQDSTACAVNNTTPQGQLLSMMYNLREAQYINVRNRAGVDVIQLAGPARQQHQALMIQVIQAYDRANVALAGWSDQQRREALADWPGGGAALPNGRTADIREVLEFGRWVLAHECPGGAPLPDYSENSTTGFSRANGREFFRRYNVASCRAG